MPRRRLKECPAPTGAGHFFSPTHSANPPIPDRPTVCHPPPHPVKWESQGRHPASHSEGNHHGQVRTHRYRPRHPRGQGHSARPDAGRLPVHGGAHHVRRGTVPAPGRGIVQGLGGHARDLQEVPRRPGQVSRCPPLRGRATSPTHSANPSPATPTTI